MQCGDIEFEFCANAWLEDYGPTLGEGCAVIRPVGRGIGEELEGVAVVVGEVEVNAVGLVGFFEVFGGILSNEEGDGVLGFVSALEYCLLKLQTGRLQGELHAFALVVVSVYRCDGDNDDDCAEHERGAVGCGEHAFLLLMGWRNFS